MKRLITFAAAALIGLHAIPLPASTFVAMTEADLISKSDRVIQGEVLKVHSHWSKSGRIVVTDATIRVDEVLIGDSPEVIQVRTFGGRVNDFVVETHGFPVFQAGKKVILYLYEEPSDRSLRVLGYQQGHFRVVTRLDGVTLAVPQVDQAGRLLRPDGSPVPIPASVEIGAFKRHLRAAAEKLGRTDIHRSPASHR
ncbi:MAG TPA: hypothetical protein VFG91_07205 [Woeseiaceae bacterium]|nr:hypothetical protein [Woeseiaceae bacterium]